jgi:hypothetical protein
MVVVSLTLPDVPVMVTELVPVVAELLAAKVTVLELVELVGLNEAVTPLGNPDAAKVTLLSKLPESVTVIVSVAVLPWITDRVDAEGAIEKPLVPDATVMLTALEVLVA